MASMIVLSFKMLMKSMAEMSKELKFYNYSVVAAKVDTFSLSKKFIFCCFSSTSFFIQSSNVFFVVFVD